MKVIFWLLVAIGILYAFYAVAVAAYSYIEVKDLVTETIKERAAVDRYERATRVREEILKKAPQSGITLDERAVSVTEENRILHVRIRWSYPVAFYKGRSVVSIPFTFDKSFQLHPGPGER
jgi:heme exporter protein D